jgi:HEAT repeat protein
VATASAEVPEELLTELQPMVETGLASDDVAVQSWAIQAAALTGQEPMIDAIVGALDNTNPPVRIAAATSLIRLEEEEAAARAVLVMELLEGDAGVRGLILNSILYQLGDEVRRDVLDEVLDTTIDESVIQTIVSHIAQRGDGEIHELLERAAELDDPAARAPYISHVSRAARPIGVRVAEALLDSSDAVRRLEGAEIAFAVNNLEARQLLERILDSDDAALAQRAGFHLARYGNAVALGKTSDLARNTEMDESLRMDAIALLRDNGAQLVSWADIQVMLAEEGRSVEFQTRVYELAGATRDPEALEHLRGLLDGLFADERLSGIAGYGYAGQDDAVATLAEIVGGAGDQLLRLRAAAALGHLGTDLAADALMTALRAERVAEVKVAIVSALGTTASTVAPMAVAQTLALQNTELSLAALDALEALGSSEVAPQVESAAVGARSPEVRWRATVVLTRLDPELGQIRLIQALDRPPEGFLDELQGLPDSILDAVDNRLLMHADTVIREAALFRVMRRPDRGYAVLQPLVESAGSPDVRRQAISVVTAAGLPEDADIFVGLTSDTDRSMRLQGFAALAHLGETDREEFFRGYLNHADVALRLIATYGIMRMHDGE